MSKAKKENSEQSSPQEQVPESIKRFVDQILQYDDHTSTDLSKPIDGWPGQFPLKVAATRVAQVEIAWREFAAALVTSFISYGLKKGGEQQFPGETFESFMAKVTNDPTAGRLIFQPILQTAFYIFKHAPEKLNYALADLILEARQHTATARTAKEGLIGRSYTEFARSIVVREQGRIVTRMKLSGTVKPKSKRGQYSQWTRTSLLDAITEAVRSLSKQKGKRRRPLEYDTVTKELHKLFPEKAPKTWDGLRQLIKRFDLKAEWLTLKSEWPAAVNRPTGQ